MLKKLLALCLSVALFQTMLSQQVYMRKISDPNGIRAHDIYSVFEDSKHYLWFTTDGGVWRFDGKEYKNYTTENGLPDNVVFAFFEDTKGRIWFNSYSSKLAYIEHDSIHSLPCNDTLSQIKRAEIPASLCVDKNGNVYASCFRSDNFIKVRPPYGNKDISLITPPDSSEFFSIVIDGNNLVSGSIVHYSSKLYRKITFYCGNFQKTEVTGAWDNQPGHRISGDRQRDGSFLINADNTVLEYKNSVLRKLTSLKYQILSSLKDSYGNYWISTIDGGLFLFRKEDTLFESPSVYLAGKVVGRILQDHEGAYWITTLNDGIYYIPGIDVALFNASEGISAGVDYTYYDPSEKITFCTDIKGELFILQKNRIIHKGSCNISADRINLVRGILKINPAEYLFIGRYSFIYNLKKRTPSFLDNPAGINTLSSPRGGKIFVSRQYLLMEFDIKTRITKNVRSFGVKINSIDRYNDSIICLGTERGLILYDHLNDKILQAPNEIEKKGIAAILSISAKRKLIIYKSDGIIMLDELLKPIISLRINVQGYSIKHVYLDAFSTIWISTNKGILKIDSNLQVKAINEYRGLPSNIINSICADSLEVYVADNLGLTLFPINKNFSDTVAPDIYLDKVFINNAPIAAKDMYTLSYDQNFIKLRFTAIHYRANNDLVCKYKLNGIDSLWKTTRANEIEYTTLPPGEYRFEMYAVNDDGVRSKSIVVSFHILAPVWQRWWFVTTGILVLLVFTYLVFRWRIRLVQKRNAEKSGLQQALIQAEMQGLRSQMNPHFIFNAINSIQHFILSNEPGAANKYLLKFSKLIRNVLEQSKREFITLAEELETLYFYIEIESLRFEEAFKFNVEIDPQLDATKLKIPSLTLQPFVENAIWHGLLLKKGEKELFIGVKQKDGLLQIEIADNGIGREAARAFGSEKGPKKSFGISITKDRLDLLSRTLAVKINVEIIDRKNARGEASGTIVLLRTPLIK